MDKRLVNLILTGGSIIAACALADTPFLEICDSDLVRRNLGQKIF